MGKKLDKMRELLISLKTLTVRKFSTIYHEKAWQSYERVLGYRATIAQVTSIFYFILFSFIGNERTQMSKKFLEEGKPANPEL